MQVQKLYPQYQVIKDRRNEEVPVAFERRSGMDRRTESRVRLDSNLTRDIFEIKSRVNEISKINPKFSSSVESTQNASVGAINTIARDQFVKTTKPEAVEKPDIPSKSGSKAGLTAGVLACALGGVLAGALFGPAGAVMALGLGVYLGGRLVKEVIASHLRENK